VKSIVKYSKRVTIVLALCAAVVSGSRCSISKAPDPLAGFYVDALHGPDSNNTIATDYKTYIQKLSPEEKKYVGPITLYTNKNSEHVVVVEVDLNGTAWYHALFYDKNDKRIKVIKYVGYHYMS
jgi:hypothetical protein